MSVKTYIVGRIYGAGSEYPTHLRWVEGPVRQSGDYYFWPGTQLQFRARRGVLVEWTHDGGRAVAREVGGAEQAAVEEAEQRVLAAEVSLLEARAHRQAVLETLVPHLAVARVT